MVNKRRTAGLLLFQSGATDWDRLGRVQGSTDLPMSETGRAEVQERIRALAQARLGVVIAGPDEASRETARMVAKATKARVRIEEELAEPSLGLWEGLAFAELGQRCRGGRTFVEDGAGVVPPGAEECLAGYRARVWPAVLAAIKGHGDASVGLVLRPLAMGVCRCELEGEALEGVWSMVRDRPPMEWFVLGRTDAPTREPARAGAAPVFAGFGLNGRLA